MRHLSLLAALLLLTLCLASCSDSKKDGGKLGQPTSAPYELLVVAPKDWLNGSQGEPLRQIIEKEIPCLTQVEANFRVTSINPVAFRGAFLYYANVLMADIGSKYAEAEMQVARNVYCQPQVLVKLVAPDEASFARLCEERIDDVLRLFNDSELRRGVQRLQRQFSGIVQKQAQKQFGCDVRTPEELNAIKVGKDFFWASAEGRHENYLNLCMYSYAYTSADQLTDEAIVQKRDSFMRQNIEGETLEDGRVPYMTTDHRVMQTRAIKVGNVNVIELRGLWAMEYDAMGGPFVSYTFVDTDRQRILTAEGFVYAPNKKKRELIRRLEAALQTVTLNK